MNMLVVNGQLYSRSTGARSTTLVPVLQKNIIISNKKEASHLEKEFNPIFIGKERTL